MRIPDCPGCIYCFRDSGRPTVHAGPDVGGHLFIDEDKHLICDYCDYLVPEEWRGAF